MRRIRMIWHWARRQGVISLALLAISVFGFRSAIADWNDVPTGSMKPTILVGDRIFVNKLAYDVKLPFVGTRLVRVSEPARGDIVTCWSPADGVRLVKRIVGVPGDQIVMRNGRLEVNGVAVDYVPLTDPAVAASLGDEARGKRFFREDLPGRSHVVAYDRARPSAREFGPVTVPADSYLMMGDNRDNSADSRYFGYVPRDDILGRVEGTVWSLDFEHGYRPRWSRFLADMI